MVATLILVRDDKGNLLDQEGYLRNAEGQRIDAQGAAILESDTDATGATLHVDEAAQTRTLVDYNSPEQFYTNHQPSCSHYSEGFRVEATLLHTRGTDTLLWVISRASYGPSTEVRGSYICY